MCSVTLQNHNKNCSKVSTITTVCENVLKCVIIKQNWSKFKTIIGKINLLVLWPLHVHYKYKEKNEQTLACSFGGDWINNLKDPWERIK